MAIAFDSDAADKSRGLRYELTEGAGLWAFAVVASDSPLPPFRDWAAGKVPAWEGGPASEARPGAVWRDDGQRLEAIGPGGPIRGDRGKGAQAADPSAVVVRLTNRLKSAGADAAGVFAFAVVQPK